MQWRKSLFVRDNTVAAEDVGDFLRSISKKWRNVSKKLAKNVSKSW